MKRFFLLGIPVLLLSCLSAQNSQDTPQSPNASQSPSESKNSSASLEEFTRPISSRAFCPTEIKNFMKSYPDIEYSALYDIEENDWKISMTADLYFERTAKPKGKKSAEFYWAGGRMLPKEELANKENYWILQYSYQNTLRDPVTYTQEEIERITHFGSSENRRNAGGTPMFFFDFLYSAQSQRVIEDHIISTTFLGKPTRIHERIYTPIKNAEKKICELAQISTENLKSAAQIAKIDPNEAEISTQAKEAREFVISLKSADAYYWREIAGTARKSFHAYGIAVDVLPKRLNGKAIYWAWEKDKLGDKWMLVPLEKRWTPGEEIIRIFESEGFIWGGYWAIFDNMHFEYHPELVKK